MEKKKIIYRNCEKTIIFKITSKVLKKKIANEYVAIMYIPCHKFTLYFFPLLDPQYILHTKVSSNGWILMSFYFKYYFFPLNSHHCVCTRPYIHERMYRTYIHPPVHLHEQQPRSQKINTMPLVPPVLFFSSI